MVHGMNNDLIKGMFSPENKRVRHRIFREAPETNLKLKAILKWVTQSK